MAAAGGGSRRGERGRRDAKSPSPPQQGRDGGDDVEMKDADGARQAGAQEGREESAQPPTFLDELLGDGLEG